MEVSVSQAADMFADRWTVHLSTKTVCSVVTHRAIIYGAMKLWKLASDFKSNDQDLLEVQNLSLF